LIRICFRDRTELYDEAIAKANDDGFDGQLWARESMHGVLDAAGGGGAVPESRLAFAAGVTQFETMRDDLVESGELSISVEEGHADRIGVDPFKYRISQAGENEGFYRVEGVSFFPSRDNVFGFQREKFDAIIDRTGDVIDGYELERRTGTHTTNHDFNTENPWDGRLGDREKPDAFNNSGKTDLQQQYARFDYIEDKTAELDKLVKTDLSAAYPESAALHESAPWTQDRAERALENARKAAYLEEYLSDARDAYINPEPHTPYPGTGPDSGLQITPIDDLDLEPGRNFTPLPSKSSDPIEAEPTSHAAPSSTDLLAGSDYNWVQPNYLAELTNEHGRVDGVELPIADTAQNGFERFTGQVRDLFKPDPPGISLSELSGELRETSREVNALDRAENGEAYSSPEGWRLGHPETRARWDTLAEGIADGRLTDMKIDIDLTNEDGERLSPHERAEVLSDAVDRASAAQAHVLGRVPNALSGPINNFNRDYPVPGSEEALVALGDEAAIGRETDRESEREAQRQESLEDLISRPTHELDRSMEADQDYGIIP